MGFSTSGAVLVILIGVLVAMSVIVPTVFNVGAATGEAFSTQSEQLRDQQNTAITIESFENVTDTDAEANATVNVTNAGASSLSVGKTDVVVNGEYYPVHGSDAETTIVDGETDRPSSDIWSSGSHLEVEIHDDDLDTVITGDGDRVRITTEHGIADAATITEAGA
ncbi:flagellin [Natrarchaeobius halalkaliphilus]|uniref:Flagellin n=1 Tax=Natrarchaeobius halalkaliphilus TaxID=1679091 RepID=A0A3N6LYE7_9EURY|nr:flagellin [Natrarchaeobius halalkaliphilus]RQG86752.1 flagellin [Natrarchaeobius halalkaliphilus]